LRVSATACSLGPVMLACLALLGGPGCHKESDVVRVCTVIGCNDSLRIVLAPVAALPYQARMTFPGGEAVSFQCASEGVQGRTGDGVYSLTCGEEGFTLECNRNPSYCSTRPVQVEVIPPDGARRNGTLTPQYTVSQPNGPACEPTCYAGVATLG